MWTAHTIIGFFIMKLIYLSVILIGCLLSACDKEDACPSIPENIKQNYSSNTCLISIKLGQVAVVGNGGKFGVVNHKGEIIIPVIYEEIKLLDYDSSNPLIIVKINKKYGYLNFNGNVVVPMQYDSIDELERQKPNMYK